MKDFVAIYNLAVFYTVTFMTYSIKKNSVHVLAIVQVCVTVVT